MSSPLIKSSFKWKSSDNKGYHFPKTIYFDKNRPVRFIISPKFSKPNIIKFYDSQM